MVICAVTRISTHHRKDVIAMDSRTERTVVVVGGTGNVGPFVVRSLLERGATVAVPSRSQERLDGLRAHLGEQLDADALGRLHTFVGAAADEGAGAAVRERIVAELGEPDAVVASLGEWVAAPSVLAAPTEELQRALDGYVLNHLRLARTFVPALREAGGAYLMLQGPLAFDLYPGFDAELISIATAAQQMLFRALAQELEGSSVRIAELVCHTFIRERVTQPGAPVPGEAIGAYAAHVLSDAAAAPHGASIQLSSPDQLREIGLDPAAV
jgi:NAD(P)-dependent dehydrogenase (short-subunit alcohol dehydrogenase family)